MSLKLGILGATGKVGGELLKLLEQWSPSELDLAEPPRLFGTSRSAGKKIKFNSVKFPNTEITVQDSQPENLKGLDVLISCANGEVSEKLIPEAIRLGVKLVVDTDSFYRMDPEVPLVTVGANDEDIDWHKGIIAGPNCSTAQLIIPLKVLNDAFGIKRVVVNTYQSVSGAGKAAMDELMSQSKRVQESYEQSAGLQQIRVAEDQFAFNVIPKISKFLDNGYTKEEWKVITESRKMLHSPELKITCTAVRVPVLVGHSESINIEFLSSFNLNQVISVLKSSPEIQVWDHPEMYPMPVDAAGTNPIHVGRIRIDESAPNAINIWVVADNLLIGAALNAIRLVVKASERGKI
jgi:aspartate-semialdehyde dehydrogenase